MSESLIKRINPDFAYSDERGDLIQLVRRGYSQINVVRSKKDAFRGGHYHRFNTEAFYIIDGKLEVIAEYDSEVEKIVFTNGDFFQIGPLVKHDFRYLEDTIMVAMYSLGVEMDGKEMDIYE